MKRKVLAMLLATTMVAAAVSGCGATETTTETVESTADVADEADAEEPAEEPAEEVVEEIVPVTISMLYCDSATEPYNEEWLVWDWIEEATGVTFDLTIVPSADYTAKRELIYNSGSIPDIVAHTFQDGDTVAAGILLPISDYEDQMPNFTAWIDEYGYRDVVDSTRFADGNYYGFPVKAMDSIYQEVQWMVRTDVFDDLGLDYTAMTYEDLYDYGVILKEEYPDSTPLTNRFFANHLGAGLANIFGEFAGWNFSNGIMWDYDTDEWYYTATTDEYYAFLEYANSLFEAGVLDQEWTTLDSDTYEQRIVTGETFIMYDWVANSTRYNEQGLELDEDYNVAPVYPIEGPYGDYGLSRKGAWSQSYVFPATLADDEEHLAAVLKYLDWTFTDEAQTILTFGIEGETYEVVDGMKTALSTTAMADWGVNINELCVRQDADVVYSVFDETTRALFEQISEDGCIPDNQPQSPLSTEQMEEVAIYTTSLTDYVTAMMEKFISGEVELDYWDTYVAECVSKGSENLLAEYVEASN
ncbi:MAG: hypothetical protein R3Y47_10600 [Lachnospiraceae bacterium]